MELREYISIGNREVSLANLILQNDEVLKVVSVSTNNNYKDTVVLDLEYVNGQGTGKVTVSINFGVLDCTNLATISTRVMETELVRRVEVLNLLRKRLAD